MLWGILFRLAFYWKSSILVINLHQDKCVKRNPKYLYMYMKHNQAIEIISYINLAEAIKPFSTGVDESWFLICRPSPSVKHKTVDAADVGPTEEPTERREDFSGGSIASASSGFSSLTKKRPPLFNSGMDLLYILFIYIFPYKKGQITLSLLCSA